MESMASVRLRLSPRLMLRLILPSSALFLLSAPMDTLLFPLSVVWLEQLVWLAPLVLSAPMVIPLSPLLSRLWSLVSMAMASMESMASVRLRLSPMSMDSPTLLDSAMPTPPTLDMESTMAKQIIWGFPEFDHLTKHCGYLKQ